MCVIRLDKCEADPCLSLSKGFEVKRGREWFNGQAARV